MATLPANESHFTFKVEGTEMLVSAFEAREQISRPFIVDLDLAAEIELAFDDVVGKSALLTIESQDGDRFFNGIVNDFSQAGIDGRFFLYRARIVPVIALLAFEQDCRIFQKKKVDAIVRQVLEDAGIAGDLFDFRLQGSYVQRDYCVQYRESDLDFISRLLECEGIFYFFEHTEDRHVAVFGDGTVNYQPISEKAQILYNPGGSMVAEEEAISVFERTRRLHTGKYSMRDYLFKKPDLNLSTDATGSRYDKFEAYDYPGGYTTKKDGSDLAKVRLQEEILDGDTAMGQSDVARLLPGFTFKLSGHEIGSFNQEYFITEIVHKGKQPQVLGEKSKFDEASSYGNSFSAIPSYVTMRPQRITPRPFVYGVHTAIVTGPKGEEVYPDEHGRVKVQFHWDRLGKKDERSSCWIRVSQLWAGAGWGAMFIPRIGQEVIVDFLEGDPDQPIITGRVYHGTNRTPYLLPEEKTKSTIKSDSSKGGGGSNELRFEDKKGSEEVLLHGQKDWTIAVENDKNQTIGHDETMQVVNNRTKSVGVNQSESIGNNKNIKVGANHIETIGQNYNLTVAANKSETVGTASTETVGVAKSLTIGEGYQVTVGANMNETVGAAKSEQVGTSKSVTVGSDLSYAVGATLNVSVGASHSEDVAKSYGLHAKTITIQADKEIIVKTGSAQLSMKKNGDITIKGKNISVKASKNIIMKGAKIKEN